MAQPLKLMTDLLPLGQTYPDPEYARTYGPLINVEKKDTQDDFAALLSLGHHHRPCLKQASRDARCEMSFSR
jgi:hypothetical protein